ncbi:putative ATP-binding protein involved in virulence [Mucilaginibacter sp. UYNi724]
MIQVRKIIIEEFRGIRKLEIDFKGKNFAVCGRNGTGKSGIVDALEFALTGNISRLSGEGMGSVSLKEHAPHVDSRSNPEKAKVILTVWIPSITKEVTITRTVKDYNIPTVSPETTEIKSILANVSNHPEFALSRRELIKYVISTPGDRAKEVQALLRFDKVENVRTVLQKVSNAAKKDITPLKQEKDESEKQLLVALGISDLKQSTIISAVNIKREVLGLDSILEMTSTTSIKDGLTTTSVDQNTVPKAQAIADIKSLKVAISELKADEVSKAIKTVSTQLVELNESSQTLTDMNRASFLKQAILFIDGESCPVCETPWSVTDLKDLINKKLSKFDAITKKRVSVEEGIEPLATKLSHLQSEILKVESYGNVLNPKIVNESLKNFRNLLGSKIIQLQNLLPISDTLAVLTNYGSIPDEVLTNINDIGNEIIKIPEPSTKDAAKEYLTISQERLDLFRSVSLRHKQAIDKSNLASKVFDTYAKSSTDFLNGIYKEVETEFSDLYRFINQDDESSFSAQLIPSIGKLGFDVDFYGRGFFPPGAYHSEGHQDGMGLCLYLALMKYLAGEYFTFAVLDDVLMSVDTGHRREVCKLLKEKFPNTQFILTTHDEVWLKHMIAFGLIQSKSSMHFRNWDVDNGPNEWSDIDIWNEIELNLKNNDVRAGASLLRHYLEFISAELCQNLRARVEFRGDGQFDLGDLITSATSQFNKLLLEAEKSALSWGKKDVAEEITKKRNAFSELITKTNINQWQTNVAIHYNAWANLQANDFRPVADAFHELIDAFHCKESNCNTMISVLPERGGRKVVKCACSTVNLNLELKK